MFKKTYLTYGIIILFLIGGFVLIGWPREPKGKTQGSVATSSAGESSYDFGRVQINGGNVSHLYEIKNTTSDPMMIKNIYTSCMCTTAYFLKDGKRVGPFGMPGHGGSAGPAISETLAPQAKAQVEVVFDPAAHGPAGLGKIERMVTVETLDHEPMQMRFTAEVTP